MNFYQRYAIPRLTHLVMRQNQLLPFRQRVIGAAEGQVLEIGIDSGLNGVVVTQIDTDGAAAEAGLSAGDVVVQVQQEKVGGPEDVDRLIDLARKRQRHYAAVLVQRNSEGLRWIAMSLE